MLSPENALENILPMPPPVVSICMLGVIQTIEPFSVIIRSPSVSSQTTTGNAPPLISYFMGVLLLLSGWIVVKSILPCCGNDVKMGTKLVCPLSDMI